MNWTNAKNYQFQAPSMLHGGDQYWPPPHTLIPPQQFQPVGFSSMKQAEGLVLPGTGTAWAWTGWDAELLIFCDVQVWVLLVHHSSQFWDILKQKEQLFENTVLLIWGSLVVQVCGEKRLQCSSIQKALQPQLLVFWWGFTFFWGGGGNKPATPPMFSSLEQHKNPSYFIPANRTIS